jgi:glucokinase
MNPSKTILTLDAGGTNFVFSAMQNKQEIVEPIRLPSEAHDLEKCLDNLIKGFKEVQSKIDHKPDAISFAFPGPADYPNGIIGNLPNFKAFNGGVAMGPMLEEVFGVPVFINNDGDLFAYGEALAGRLPEINQSLEEGGSPKTFKHLLGLTIGTGFGAGIVIDQALLTGDNSCGAGIHATINPFNHAWNAEESVSTRAIQREYAIEAGLEFNEKLMPGDIYKIAKGEQKGDQQAAVYSFEQFGAALGFSITNASTLIDGLVVIGGGLAGGWDLFAPSMFKALQTKFKHPNGDESERLSCKVFNLENEAEAQEFISGNPQETIIPRTNKTVIYDDSQRIGIGRSKLGASKAISLGAYAFAVQKLNK